MSEMTREEAVEILNEMRDSYIKKMKCLTFMPDKKIVAFDYAIAALSEQPDINAFRSTAAVALEHWDNDRDTKVGKLLKAMSDPEFAKSYLPGIPPLHTISSAQPLKPIRTADRAPTKNDGTMVWALNPSGTSWNAISPVQVVENPDNFPFWLPLTALPIPAEK